MLLIFNLIILVRFVKFEFFSLYQQSSLQTQSLCRRAFGQVTEDCFDMTAVVVFDLDGTLIDSIAGIGAAANRMLAEEGQAPLTLATVLQFVGNGLPKFVERTIHHRGLDPARHADLTQRMLAIYESVASHSTTAYPGVAEALSQLRNMGCVMGVCTNKPEGPARSILRDLDLLQYFDSVIGGDTLSTRKPDPKHLLASFDALPSVGPRIFVGDSEVDAETALRAEVPFLLFSEGYSKTPVADLPHTALYGDSLQLPDLVRQIQKT